MNIEIVKQLAKDFGIPGMVIGVLLYFVFIIVQPIGDQLKNGPSGLVDEIRQTRAELSEMRKELGGIKTDVMTYLQTKHDDHEKRITSLEKNKNDSEDDKPKVIKGRK